MIAIKSNKELYFPAGKGLVTMEIDKIIDSPRSKIYEMRLIDTCTKESTDEEGNKVITQVGQPITRFKTMTYPEIDALYALLNVDSLEISMREKIGESFRQGLLLVTQQECLNGISGEEGKGQYYSEAQDWEIIREDEESNKFAGIGGEIKIKES